MPLDAHVPKTQKGIVDLRSDTVTRPTQAMLDAMLSAPLGDDVLGDDPTVTALEQKAGEMLGKEAGMFVPSGTMGNQIAIVCHTKRGDSILAEQEAHILFYEVGGPAVIGQVVSFTLPSDKGAMDPIEVEKRVLEKSLHTPGTSLICVENTHNRAGGTVIPIPYLAAYREIANRKGVSLHLDGARVFNAAVALGVPVKEIAQYFDSVSFCLSKGLGTPVGSVLVGSALLIEEARYWRKRLGGGMRQSGLLAACGLYALENNVERLAEDHARARRVAQAISVLPGISVDMDRVQTNIVLANFDRPAVDWQNSLAERGIWALPFGEFQMRLVFHLDIDDSMADRAVEAFQAG
ncbi:MAG: low-specificity L-threonine aldolase [Fimbriimonadaceae bacterium]|nr:low-specificity L-threonine aldolase [Fimbriimonadaceae bacterium]